MTTITLPKDLEDWARAEVAAGRAADVSGLIAEIVREHRAVYASHKALVEEAYRSVERGEAISEEDFDAEVDGWIAEDRAATK
ncbi:MAG: hypothetical protein IV086_01495 [Hyphomonadaceae bacterium]|nr:MAG: hypothetical protein FD160_3074 [Caulobacteraceae bacterium]MBT9444352.1 hypothetical protein [Hyphomonadaceae bacterium]TPW06467.1 MAG: hypothetical protein FD124_1711 [Alphaproteobacteria bacterium]